jgi:hypothetical protein
MLKNYDSKMNNSPKFSKEFDDEIDLMDLSDSGEKNFTFQIKIL